MDANAQLLTTLGPIVVIFGLYLLARRAARTGSSAAERVTSLVPTDAGRLFVPFVIAAVILWSVNALTGGVLSGPFDRFWVGLALGLGLGLLVATIALRSRWMRDDRRSR